MSTPAGVSWGSWSTDATLNAASVVTGTPGVGTAFNMSVASPNEVVAMEIGISCTYGSTVTGGAAQAYICGQTDSTPTYESPTADTPTGFALPPAVASTTVHKRIVLRADEISGGKVAIVNPSTNTPLTVTVTYRFASSLSG